MRRAAQKVERRSRILGNPRCSTAPRWVRGGSMASVRAIAGSMVVSRLGNLAVRPSDEWSTKSPSQNAIKLLWLRHLVEKFKLTMKICDEVLGLRWRT